MLSRTSVHPPRLITATAAAVAVLAGLFVAPASTAAMEPPPGPDGSVRLDPSHQRAGEIASHFVGFSIEWSLIERYMGPTAQPAFAALLGNLGQGVLRIGGSSQDLMQFDPTVANTNRVITPEDVAAVRSTLDRVRRTGRADWRTVLGTAMAPRTAARPWVGPDHTRLFVDQGVAPAFAGAEDDVAGIELGNEPDLTYRSEVAPYLADFRSYVDANAVGPFPIGAPATSEPIAPWQSIADRSVATRFFWDWPEVLDTTAAPMRASAGSLGAWAGDHFYPLARGCASDEYRCPTISRLLSDERLDNFNYGVYTHAREAGSRGLGYRLQELNTAAGRGADGVSNVAASALWALDTMFNAACPEPPDNRSANAGCDTGAVGVNFHNAEVNAFFRPEEGNGYYNAVNYDPSPAMGAPSAAPEYYGLLLFSQFAQGTKGLRRVPVTGARADGVKAWRVEGKSAQRRLFLLNKTDEARTIQVQAPGPSYLLNRLTPYDPTSAGRTLDAPAVRIDGRQVSADGTWPGFNATTGALKGGRATVELAPGEAAVLRVATPG